MDLTGMMKEAPSSQRSPLISRRTTTRLLKVNLSWQVEEMDLTEMMKEAPSSTLLPALPKPVNPTPETLNFFFFFITLGLELSDTKVYEP